MTCRPPFQPDTERHRAVRTRRIRVRVATLLLAAVGTSLAPTAAGAATGRAFVWLAGSSDTETGQVRMARQVRDITSALRTLNGAYMMRIKVPLPDAAAAAADREVTEQGDVQQAIARVYGPNGSPPRSQAPAPAGPTDASRLAQVLERDFASMSPADRGLLVYAGPGRPDPEDRTADALTLTDNSRLTVRELDHVATRAPVSAPLRFLFTQCQAAGFMRLMRPSAQDVRTLSPYNRCGFAANMPAPKAEECTTTPTGQASDYTSAFFAALGARGQVTLHEAHLHALLASNDAERPAATSEVFLERWQPAWMRYLDTSSDRIGNEYGEVASALGRKLGLPDGGQALVTAMRKLRRNQELRQEQTDQALLRIDGEIGQLQRTIRRVLAERWPRADDLLAIQGRRQIAPAAAREAFVLIQAQPEYTALIDRQQQRLTLVGERQDAARALAQLDKLVRLRHLARLQDQFEHFADASARKDYERISQCERMPL